MSLIKICESDDFVVDYDSDRGMYRVSYFEDYHFKDEIWFDAYEEKELGRLFKMLPDKVETYNCEELCDVEDWYDSGYADGWNACISSILREDKY